MLPRPRLGRTAIFVGIQLISTGCDESDAPKVPKIGSTQEPVRTLPVALLDSGASADPVAPPGDLLGEIQRFSDVGTCASERARVDPLVADGLSAIGYDTFLLDACRVLEAAKKKDAKGCREITASPLRAQCERAVALVTTSADACPFVVPSAPSRGRDPACLAATLGDTRYCDGESGDAKNSCLAFATHDPRLCARNVSGKAQCERGAERYRDLFPTAKVGPKVTLRAELSVRRDSGGETKSDASTDVERGVVVLSSAAGDRLALGEVRDLGAVAHVAPMGGARLGCLLVVGKGTDVRVDTCELEVPGAVVMRGKPAAKVVAPSYTRGEHVEGTIEGDFSSGAEHVHVRYLFSTFVRDVVRGAR